MARCREIGRYVTTQAAVIPTTLRYISRWRESVWIPTVTFVPRPNRVIDHVLHVHRRPSRQWGGVWRRWRRGQRCGVPLVGIARRVSSARRLARPDGIRIPCRRRATAGRRRSMHVTGLHSDTEVVDTAHGPVSGAAHCKRCAAIRRMLVLCVIITRQVAWHEHRPRQPPYIRERTTAGAHSDTARRGLRQPL